MSWRDVLLAASGLIFIACAFSGIYKLIGVGLLIFITVIAYYIYKLHGGGNPIKFVFTELIRRGEGEVKDGRSVIGGVYLSAVPLLAIGILVLFMQIIAFLFFM